MAMTRAIPGSAHHQWPNCRDPPRERTFRAAPGCRLPRRGASDASVFDCIVAVMVILARPFESSELRWGSYPVLAPGRIHGLQNRVNRLLACQETLNPRCEGIVDRGVRPLAVGKRTVLAVLDKVPDVLVSAGCVVVAVQTTNGKCAINLRERLGLLRFGSPIKEGLGSIVVLGSGIDGEGVVRAGVNEALVGALLGRKRADCKVGISRCRLELLPRRSRDEAGKGRATSEPFGDGVEAGARCPLLEATCLIELDDGLQRVLPALGVSEGSLLAHPLFVPLGVLRVNSGGRQGHGHQAGVGCG